MATRMRTVGRETRAAGRALLRTPGFTATAVLTLALGIGASAAIFSVVDSVVLRPLDYPEPDRLVWLDHPVPGQGEGTRWGLSVAGYFHFRGEVEALDEIGGYVVGSHTITGEGQPERLTAAHASAPLLRVLGARARIGRVLTDADDQPGAPPVMLLSDAFWARRYGRDPSVVGSTVHLDGVAMPVAGVLEPGFDLPRTHVDVWLAAGFDRDAAAQNSHYVQAIGKLAAGATPQAARTEMRGLTLRLPEVFPEAYAPSFMRSSGFTADVRELRDVVVGDIDTTLWVLLAGVGLVLLVACANVANLFLVRAEGRLRALALRRAVGADGTAVAAYFAGEGLLLAAVAGVLGLGLAERALALLVALTPPGLPRLDEVALGPATVLVTVGLVVVSGAVFGAFPLWRAIGTRPAAALVGTTGRATGTRSGRRLRDALVVAQVAMALVLLTGSGLMLRSYRRLSSVDPGFESAGVTTFGIALPRSRYPDADAVYRAQRTLLTELGSAPDVSAVGAIDALPIVGGDRCIAVSAEAPETGLPIGRGCPQVRFASPGYFDAMGIDVLSGRTFEHRDNDVRSAALVVSRAMAESLWPGREPMGRGVRLWGEGYYRVVGVVEDVHDDGLDRPAPGILYFPIVAAPGETMPPVDAVTFVVRGGADALETARRIVAGVDPDLPLSAVSTLDEVLSRSMIRTTFTLIMLGLAGAMGLVLGVVGMYAVISYAVSKRTAELGVRIALGAGAASLRSMVLAHAGLLTALGVAVGLAMSLLASRVLGSLLYGVTATDVPTLAVAALVLVVVSLAAAWVPARRATRVDPVTAMREA